MTDHLEVIENAITPLGGFFQNMGGNCRAIIFNIADGTRAILVCGDGEAEGDPEAFEWSVAHWDRDHEEIDGHDDITLQAALGYVRLWREAVQH